MPEEDTPREETRATTTVEELEAYLRVLRSRLEIAQFNGQVELHLKLETVENLLDLADVAADVYHQAAVQRTAAALKDHP